MAHLTRFLMQDHARIFRAFEAYGRDPSSLPLALTVCAELEAHATIEEELVYPILRDEIDSREADEAEQEHDEAKDLIAQVQDLEAGDPELRPLMGQLRKSVPSTSTRKRPRSSPSCRPTCWPAHGMSAVRPSGCVRS
jgi:hypothetical protein